MCIGTGRPAALTHSCTGNSQPCGCCAVHAHSQDQGGCRAAHPACSVCCCAAACVRVRQCTCEGVLECQPHAPAAACCRTVASTRACYDSTGPHLSEQVQRKLVYQLFLHQPPQLRLVHQCCSVCQLMCQGHVFLGSCLERWQHHNGVALRHLPELIIAV
jgi:hypothetical protein